MAKNLAHRQVTEDAGKVNFALPDELLIFRKRVNIQPIQHPCGLVGNYAGEEPMPADILKWRGWDGDQKQNRYSHWIWRRYASSIWDDVRMTRTLPFRPDEGRRRRRKACPSTAIGRDRTVHRPTYHARRTCPHPVHGCRIRGICGCPDGPLRNRCRVETLPLRSSVAEPRRRRH